MGVLSNCEPKKVFAFFEEICSVPHGSGNTRQVSDLCVRFAKERGLECYQDALNNVIIIKEAAPGYEDQPPIILQGHLDMVCEKTPESTFDFFTQGLKIRTEGDWITADSTTLGADDGIAVAMALAALDADDLPHPRIEAVFTVDEETGMDGARGIDLSPLKGRRMLNMDSEEEGVFTVGCAGGVRADCSIPITRSACDWPAARITIRGLKGGHSGMEIHKGRASSNQLMGRLLSAMGRCAPLRLVDVSGGRLDNVIPSLTTAVIASAELDRLEEAAKEYHAIYQREYRATDPGVEVIFERVGTSGSAAEEEDTRAVIFALLCVPYGVQVMSVDFPGLVQTSLNLGVLSMDETQFHASFSVRSSVSTQKDMITERLAAVFERAGGSVRLHSAYPAWEYVPISPFRDRMTEIFRRQYGRDPEILAVHGGLECGIFSEKIPGLDAVAIGPDMVGVHSPEERVSISSVRRVWELVKAILADRETE